MRFENPSYKGEAVTVTNALDIRLSITHIKTESGVHQIAPEVKVKMFLTSVDGKHILGETLVIFPGHESVANAACQLIREHLQFLSSFYSPTPKEFL
jgi:hypothetical protein